MTVEERNPNARIQDFGTPEWFPKIDMLFNSENDAYEFYNAYAENLGFFVRRSTLWTTSKNIVTRRTFVCSREGFREKKKGAKEVKTPRLETRIGCAACMTIRLMPNGRYRVTEFHANHNHPLATMSTMSMMKAKKMRKKARVLRADLVDDSVRTPEFETEEVAYEFYSMYAAKIGFSVRRASMTVGADNVITRRMFVCSKEGFRESKKGSKRVKKPRPETRTGCPACMIIRLSTNGMYTVSEFVTHHNHQLATPSSSELVVFQSAEFSEIDDGGSIVTWGSNDEKALDSQDIRSVSGGGNKRMKTTWGVGDVGATLEYLQRMQMENPSFFYATQIDEHDNVVNFFWADAKSLMDFCYFGDAVCLDTTYKLHGFGRPLALFTGVNHHKQTVIFGSALLYDESLKSLKWLFETFKMAVSGKQPKTILTDWCNAMNEAVASVWPGTNHRFCVWHIYQKAMEQLSQAFHGSKTLSNDFSRCLFDCEDEEEFISAWDSMIEKYDLKDNQWLVKLFEEREKWALVYGRDAFYADLKSVQLKETLYIELKKHLSSEIDLLCFFDNYDKMVNERRIAELQADVHANQNTRKLPSMRILKQAATVYTPAAFKMFEKEFELYMDCMLYSLGEDGRVSEYKVILDERMKDHFVKFDSSDLTATCTCKMFEFIGISCRHVLKVLDTRNIKDLPPQYILKRWRKDAKEGALSQSCTSLFEDGSQSVRRYNYLCRILSTVAARAAQTMDSFAVVESQSDILMDQIDQVLRTRTLGILPLVATSCDHTQNQVDSFVIGGYRYETTNQASCVGHS